MDLQSNKRNISRKIAQFEDTKSITQTKNSSISNDTASEEANHNNTTLETHLANTADDYSSQS